MELRHLRYFCAVAERLSFTMAARHLHVSQSGVSGQVRDLEKELGVKLLQRNQREVSLTPEGVIFLQEAQDIIARSQRAVELVSRAAAGDYGKLSIGLCGPATAPFLPALIRDFRKHHPEVALELKDLEPVRQPPALAEGLIDIGFARGVGPEFRKTLHSEVLLREQLLVALPGEHRLSSQQSVRLAELASESIVLYGRAGAPDLFDAIVGFCKRARFSPRITGSPGVWQSVLTLVEAGEGVALVPACVGRLQSKDIVFRPIDDRGCLLDVLVAWRRDEPSGIRDAFLRLLLNRRAATGRTTRNR